MIGSPLRPEHREHLRTSGLSDETIAAAGICSLDEADTARLGYARGLTGIGFPYPGPGIRVDGQDVPYTRLRVDPANQRRDGLKYENPLGQRTESGLTYYPYIPPGVEKLRKKRDIPILITEGEKKALKLTQEGFPAIGLPGVYMFSDPRSDKHPAHKPLHPELLRWPWRKRTVLVCFDSDRVEKDSVALAQERLCARLTAAGARVLVVNVPKLPGMDKTGADDYLVHRGRDAFQALIQAAHPWEPYVYLVELLPEGLAPGAIPAALANWRCLELDRSERYAVAQAICRRFPSVSLPDALRMLGQDEPESGVMPEILTNARQTREIVADAWAVILASRYGSWLFLYGLSIVLIEGGTLRPVDLGLMAALLNRIASWVMLRRGKLVDTRLPMEVPRDMITLPDRRLPVLKGMIQTPVIHRDGTLHAKDGYDPESQLFVTMQDGLAVRLALVPRHPSARQRQDALAWLRYELLVDFPFAGPTDLAHALAMLLLPLVRHLIDGPTPLHLIEAPSPGTGKTLLASVVALLATGAELSPTAMPQSENEVRKKLTALLMTSPAMVLLDNLTTALDSESLAALLTGTSWSDRLLGQTRMVELPNLTLWIATANNPILSREMSRRAIRIRLNADEERPWLREGFRHNNLLAWLGTRRPEGLIALLTLVQVWIAEGCPAGTVGLGSFDAWAQTIGGILSVAGVEGFLANRADEAEIMDPEEQDWETFIQVWLEQFGERLVSSRELLVLAQDSSLLDFLPGRQGAASIQIRFARALSSRRDRRYGPARICVQRDAHAKKNRYFRRVSS